MLSKLGCLTCSLLIFSLALSSTLFGQTDSFDILVTNDDGIESPGIQKLAQALRAVGNVHVVAPCGERSGSSMSVALRAELELRSIQRGQAVEYCVDTTPAGAVMLAITSLSPPGGFDLVISGINRGANVGTASHMSGTVGSAMMGAFYGLPAVAVSLGARSPDFDYSARFVANLVRTLKRHQALPGVVLSVNIPQASEQDIAGVMIAKMGGIHLKFAYEEVQDDRQGRRFRPRIGRETDFPKGSDTAAFMSNHITITPIAFDWTAYSVLDELKQWGLVHKVP